MKNTTTLSALVLYATAACGIAEEVNSNRAITTTYNETGGNTGGNGGSITTGGLGGEAGNGGNNYGGFAGQGGNNNHGGFGGAVGNGGAGGDCEDLTGKFTTYSQGGWNNHANILPSTLFVNGVLIGKNNSDYAVFTSVNAVTNFLPAMGTPGALLGQYTNPLTTPAGVLAGQTLALKLNIAISNEAYGYKLDDLIVTEGVCKDKTVSEIQNVADQLLSGMTASLSYSDLNKCVEKINLNFKEGTVNNNYLTLP